MRCAIALAAATLLGFTAHADVPPDAAAAAAAEPAVWTPKQVNFTYQGFTARYSCDGLASKVKKVLLRLGARKDLQVSPTGCSSGYGRPSSFPGVRIRMNVLTPADTTGKNSAVPSVPAVWKRVDVVGKGDPVNQAGECELIEQIKESILPQFTTRNVDYSSTCVPHQLQVGGTRLIAEVLTSDADATKAPAAP